jgi:hypothetical protein
MKFFLILMFISTSILFSITLQEAKEIALENNLSLQNARTSQRISSDLKNKEFLNINFNKICFRN